MGAVRSPNVSFFLQTNIELMSLQAAASRSEELLHRPLCFERRTFRWASNLDTWWAPSVGGFLGRSMWLETRGADLGQSVHPQFPQEQAEDRKEEGGLGPVL